MDKTLLKLFLINEMSPDWKRASDLLGLKPTHTRRIEMNKHTVEDRCREQNGSIMKMVHTTIQEARKVYINF